MKKILILLTILYSSYTFTEIQNVLHENHKNNQQKIIIINGSSSAGKTSIIKHIQQASTAPLLTIGIDLLWEIIPPQYTNTGLKAQEGFLFVETKDDSDRPLITVKAGSFALYLNQQLPALIKSLAETGLDIIIDEAFIEESILFHYVKELYNYNVYFIGVMCDLSELERREKSRGDREIGLARGQVDVVHKHHSYYDFIVDTTHTSTDKCVQEIVSYINNNSMPIGFKRLYNTLSQ